MTRVPLLAMFLFVGGAGLLAQPVPRIRVQVDAVQIDALVTSGGRPVRGLTARDFEVRDNGTLQTVDRVDAEEVPLDVVLALDASESVEGRPLRDLVAAARTTLRALRPQDRAMLVPFSHRLSAPVPLTMDRAALVNALEHMKAEGATALFDAAFTSLVVGGEPGRRSLGLIYTDGMDTNSWLRPDDVVKSAKRTDTVVYVIAAADVRELHDRLRLGSFDSIDEFLKELAESTGGALLFAEKAERLERVFSRVIDEFKNRYLIAYYPKGVDRRGWHTVDVRLKNRTGQVQARRGYQAD